MTPFTNSLLIAICSTCAAGVIGVLAAFALVAVSSSRRLVVLFLILSSLPLLIPSYVLVSFWMEALGANCWLSRLVANGHAVPLTGLGPSIVVLSLIHWPMVALVCYSTLTTITSEMLESAELAVGKWRSKLYVVAPLLYPSLVLSAALVFVLTLSNFSVPAIFQVRTIQNEIYVQFNANFDVSKALHAATPQWIAVLMAFAICLLRLRPWHMRTRIWFWQRHLDSRRRFGANRIFWLAAGCLSLLVLFSTIAPLLRVGGAFFHGNVLWDTLVVSRHQIWNSFLFSACTATVVVALTFWRVPALHTDVWQFQSDTLSALLIVPFLLPEVLIGIGLIAVFNQPGLQWIYTSMAIVLIALTIRYLVVGHLAAVVGRCYVNSALYEPAQMAGLSPMQIRFRINLPLVAPWLFAGWWLTYLFCLADVGSLVLIYPPGCDTVPIRIFNLLHYGYDTQVSVLCLVMLVLAAVPFLAWGTWMCVRRLRTVLSLRTRTTFGLTL